MLCPLLLELHLPCEWLLLWHPLLLLLLLLLQEQHMDVLQLLLGTDDRS